MSKTTRPAGRISLGAEYIFRPTPGSPYASFEGERVRPSLRSPTHGYAVKVSNLQIYWAQPEELHEEIKTRPAKEVVLGGEYIMVSNPDSGLGCHFDGERVHVVRSPYNNMCVVRASSGHEFWATTDELHEEVPEEAFVPLPDGRRVPIYHSPGPATLSIFRGPLPTDEQVDEWAGFPGATEPLAVFNLAGSFRVEVTSITF